MPNRKHQFSEFIQVRNLRNGNFVDGAMVGVWLDLIVGPFSFRNVYYAWKSNSVQFRQGKNARIKPAFIPHLRKIIVQAIKQFQLDKSPDSGYTSNRGAEDEESITRSYARPFNGLGSRVPSLSQAS